MIENKFEERQVTQRVLTDHTYICDVCGRKMKIPQHYWNVSITKADKDDNWEPINAYDCCSIECAQKLYNKYFKESQESLNNKDWIEITHQHTRSVDEINGK